MYLRGSCHSRVNFYQIKYFINMLRGMSSNDVKKDWSEEVLLSEKSRDRCIANLRQVPKLTLENSSKSTAAVLVPFCVVDGEVSLLYTLRSVNLKHHKGQVSFPGGKTDGTETSIETALRETDEEIGIPKEEIDIWTTVNPLEGRSGIHVTPVVGVVKDFNITRLKLNAAEVDTVFTVPLRELTNPANQAHTTYSKSPIPVYLYKKFAIWGMTAIITHTVLLALLPNNLYKTDGFLTRKLQIEDLMPSKL